MMYDKMTARGRSQTASRHRVSSKRMCMLRTLTVIINAESAATLSIVAKVWNNKKGLKLQTPVFSFSYLTPIV